MSNDRESVGDADAPLGGEPEADDVLSRADGRPPEEQSSEDPAAQAEAILQDSEDRTADGAAASE
jgi:hypothetical protein